jgi:hypothetical protein
VSHPPLKNFILIKIHFMTKFRHYVIHQDHISSSQFWRSHHHSYGSALTSLHKRPPSSINHTMPTQDDSSDSDDNIPLSQFSPDAISAARKSSIANLRAVAASRKTSNLSSASLHDAMNPAFDDNSDGDDAEDSDLGYQPRPAQLSRNRPRESGDSDSSSSSDGEPKKPRARTSKAKKKKTSEPPKQKCQGKACPGLPPTELRPMVKCALRDCVKMVHHVCYERMLSKSTVARNPVDNDTVFCKLTHHDQYVRETSENELTWTNDGKDGPNDPKNSQYYLVQWLSTESNYQNYRDPPGAMTKMKVCEDVARWINSKGVKNTWKGDNVYNKICHMESKVKSCHDGYAGTKTGHGVKESDPMGYEDNVSIGFICLMLEYNLPLQSSYYSVLGT